MTNPRVSIILPVYNAAAYVAGAINSVLRQTLTDFELIIINDGSTDGSAEIVKGFSDERIKIINNDSNLGLQLTLNKALKMAGGDYIARIDADDEWVDADKLKEQAAFLDNNRDCVLVGTGAIVVDRFEAELYRVVLPRTDHDIRQKMLAANQFFHSAVMIRRSALDKVGGYSEAIESKHVEDYDLWLRLGRVGSLYNLPLLALRYRDLGSSVSRQNVIRQFRQNIALIKNYRRDYPGYLLALGRNQLKLLFYGHGRLLSLRKYILRLKPQKLSQNNRPRILVWESLSNISGGQRALLNIVPYLSSNFSLTAIVPAPGDLSQELAKMGVAIKFINPGRYSVGRKSWLDMIKYPVLFLGNVVRSFRLVRGNDLVYVNSTRVLPPALLSALLFNKPVVWHNHNLISHRLTRWFLQVIIRLPNLKKVIAVSGAVAEQFPALAGKTQVVYNGVDLNKFLPQLQPSKNGFKNIVVIGDLMPSKGQDVLIKALVGLDDFDYRLRIIGAPRPGMEAYESGLQGLVKNFSLSDKVEFLGRRHDISQILAEADLLVLPATGAEACPLVVLEALAAAVPVIVSDQGGTKEIIANQGAGYLFTAGSETDLRAKLKEFFGLSLDEIIAMKTKCRELAEHNYNLADSAGQISKIIKSVIN